MIVLIIAIVAIFANSWHVFAAWVNQPVNTYFTGIAHFYADYFLYTSLMAQKGWIFTDHLFTNESLKPTWIYWLYTILGKFGNSFVVYNVSIIGFSAFLLFLWWKIIAKLTADKFTQITAFLLLTTASGFTGYDFWFSPLPALNRLGGVPHQIFQTILLLGMMLVKPTGLLFLSFFAAITNPIQTLLLSLALIIVKRKNVFYLLPAAAGALLTNATFANDPILFAAKQWENSQNVSVNLWQFILAIGPIALLIPFGLKTYGKDITPLRKTLFIYGILSLLMFFSPLPKMLGTSPVRWLSPAAYTVLPILAAEGLKKFKIPILFIYLFFTIPSIFNQITARQNAPRDLLYVPNEVVLSLRNLKGEGVVLTNPSLPYDVLIPALTGKRSFSGHPIHTLYPEVKEELRRKYFEGTMTEEEKQKFLTDHNIGTVYEP